MEGTRVQAHGCQPARLLGVEHWGLWPAQSGLAPCPDAGGNVNLALLLHHLDLLRIPVDLTDLQPALVQTEAVPIPWRTPCASRPNPGWPTTSTRPCWPTNWSWSGCNGVLLQTLRALTLFRGDSHNLSNYLSLLGASRALRDPGIC